MNVSVDFSHESCKNITVIVPTFLYCFVSIRQRDDKTCWLNQVRSWLMKILVPFRMWFFILWDRSTFTCRHTNFTMTGRFLPLYFPRRCAISMFSSVIDIDSFFMSDTTSAIRKIILQIIQVIKSNFRHN